MDKNIKLNEEKVLNEYFDYLKSDEATIVYIAKNLVNNLDTKKKWIDVVDYDCWGSRGGRLAFNYIVVELFDRKVHPKYPQYSDSKLRQAITWRACHEDIALQRSKGIKGQIFLITCQLIYKNIGKREEKFYHIQKEYGVSNYSRKAPTSTISRKVKWEYRITGCRKINHKRLINIRDNYEYIYDRILDNKYVLIDWFFEKYHEVK